MEVEDGFKALHIFVEIHPGVADDGLMQAVQLDDLESGVDPVNIHSFLASQPIVTSVYIVDRLLYFVYFLILLLQGISIEG